MTSAEELRAVMSALVGFAAVQEQLLLAGAQQAEPGDASCWAALPLVAHNTEFTRQQVQRLRAIRSGQAPPDFAEADHRSAALVCRAIRAARRLGRAGQLAGERRTARGGARGSLGRSAGSFPASLAAREAAVASGNRARFLASGRASGRVLPQPWSGGPGRGTCRGSRGADLQPRRPRSGPRYGQLQPGLRAWPAPACSMTRRQP